MPNGGYQPEGDQLLGAAKRASTIGVDDVDSPEECGGPEPR